MIVDHPIFGLHQETLARTRTFTLEASRRLLAVLGNPQIAAPRILVAGTNGKGSTAMALSRLLGARGYRVGLYTSPHVIALNERISFNQKEIADEALLKLLDEVESRARGADLKPSFFELMTAAAQLYFSRNEADWTVLEVGLGGRLDATHAYPPEVAVFSPIDFDHMQFLGDSQEAIAWEKAAIIPEKGLAVSSAQKTNVAEVLIERAQSQNTPLYIEGRDFDDGLLVNHDTSDWPSYQRQNVLLALATLHFMEKKELLSARPTGDPTAAVRDFNVRGRLQLLPGEPRTYLDGAHNPQAIRVVFQALCDKNIPFSDLHVVLAIRDDKDWEEMLSSLPKNLGSIATCELSAKTDLGVGRFVPALELAQHLESNHKNVFAEELPEMALKNARARAQGVKSAVLVTGSFYLVGRLLRTEMAASC